jgi:hypothetical protein
MARFVLVKLAMISIRVSPVAIYFDLYTTL